jgi:hypothetical protein
MKPQIKLFAVIFLTSLILGCGREVKRITPKIRNTAAISERSSCPLKFSQNGLCGEIHWVTGPTVDQSSSFEVTFWNQNSGSEKGPWVEPSAQVGAFIRMTCCGSVFFPKISKIENGKYLASDVKFTPGKWEVYVQLKNGNTVEKQFITVNLDD